MLTNAHVWREARERLRPQMTRAQFDTWLRGTRLVTLEQSAAVLAVPTTFAKELLESQYRERIEAALGAVTGHAFALQVVVVSGHSSEHLPAHEADGSAPGVAVRARVASRPLATTREHHRPAEGAANQEIQAPYARVSLFGEGPEARDGSQPHQGAGGTTPGKHRDEEVPESAHRPRDSSRNDARVEARAADTAAHSVVASGERSAGMTKHRSAHNEDHPDDRYAGDRGGSAGEARPEGRLQGQAHPPMPSASGTHPLYGNASSRSGVPAPRLNPRYTFKTFIVGSSNQLAYAASVAVGEAPGQAYNPLFLYGGVGLGKTHLLHAVGHAAQTQGLEVLYVTSETFTNEIVNAIRYRTTEEFRAKYRTADVLLVDDIQFIAGKDSTEEEFFHTFNSLYESGRQIVICSDHPPKAIVSLEERLRSRFEWGLIADVQPPDFGTRVAILRSKAETMQRQVPDDVIDYLADRIQSNIRELEGSLNRLLAFSTLQRAPLTVDVAKAALATLASDARARRISIAEVLAAVSEFYRISPDDLRGKQRDKHIVVPRQVAMYLMRQETEASLLEIGQALGGRDHSTVLHGCDKIGKEINENTALRKEIVTIRQRLQG